MSDRETHAKVPKTSPPFCVLSHLAKIPSEFEGIPALPCRDVDAIKIANKESLLLVSHPGFNRNLFDGKDFGGDADILVEELRDKLPFPLSKNAVLNGIFKKRVVAFAGVRELLLHEIAVEQAIEKAVAAGKHVVFALEVDHVPNSDFSNIRYRARGGSEMTRGYIADLCEEFPGSISLYPTRPKSGEFYFRDTRFLRPRKANDLARDWFSPFREAGIRQIEICGYYLGQCLQVLPAPLYKDFSMTILHSACISKNEGHSPLSEEKLLKTLLPGYLQHSQRPAIRAELLSLLPSDRRDAPSYRRALKKQYRAMRFHNAQIDC